MNTLKAILIFSALASISSQAACGLSNDTEHKIEAPVATPETAPASADIPGASQLSPVVVAPATGRATVAQVQFAYPHSRCAYLYSPTHFCDDLHQHAYARALESMPANFADGLIILDIPTRLEYHQKSLVVIEPDTGIVWPFPFDAYAGPLDASGSPIREGTLEFSPDSKTACIDGSLLVYRVIDTGRFCFTYLGEGRFEGHITQYMQDAE